MNEPIRRLPLHLAAVCLLLSPALHAHGGQYRGPGEVTPPNPTGGSSGGNQSGGGNAGPTSTGTGGTSSGAGPTTPAAGTGATSGRAGAVPLGAAPRGVTLDDDLTRWEFWWEYRKDPYLRWKDRQRGGSVGLDDSLLGGAVVRRKVELPTTADVDDHVMPALVQALGATRNRDLASGAMVALAKIGRDGKTFRLFEDVLVPRLSSHDQEMRETAALCLGLAAAHRPANVHTLIDLALDTPAARALSRNPVNDRTRTFAVYGLALALDAGAAVGDRARILRCLEQTLRADHASERNLLVATILALGHFGAGDDSPASRTLAAEAVRMLSMYSDQQLGPGAQLIQAHCHTSIARLLAPADAEAEKFRRRCAELLATTRENRELNPTLTQSAAMALGMLALPCDDAASPMLPYLQQLRQTWREHGDRQTRYFAIQSIAQMGGAMARQTLLQELGDAGKVLEKPWVAIALGTLAGRRHAAAGAGVSREVDRELASRLLEELIAARTPSTIGALALALGMAGHTDAVPALEKLLTQMQNQDEVAGHLAVALGLLDSRASQPQLLQLLRGSVRKPVLLVQTAVALGRIGDRDAANELCAMLSDGSGSLARLSALASGLGQIGDRSSLQPLLKVLQDDSLTELTRAFAAVALGNVCDPRPLPWNWTFANGTNYRAAVETLSDGAAGILDIL